MFSFPSTFYSSVLSFRGLNKTSIHTKATIQTPSRKLAVTLSARTNQLEIADDFMFVYPKCHIISRLILVDFISSGGQLFPCC